MLKQVQHDVPRLLADFIKNVTLREAIPMEELVSGSYLKICHWHDEGGEISLLKTDFSSSCLRFEMTALFIPPACPIKLDEY